MGFTPTFDTLYTNTTLSDEDTETPTFPRIARPSREVLRFGGLSMDTVTGAVFFRGKSIALSLDDRELLGVLLRRAGQILSAEHLAILLRTRADTLADRMDGLRETLKAAGVTCLPCQADGLGYVLWRC